MTPYIFRTDDDGQTWRRIAGPDQGAAGLRHVIREDLERPDLLFAGTEFGLWISVDGGARWAQFKPGNFPAVAVRDLVIAPRDHDLVLGTHGRGIWIVDDITPLRHLSDQVLAAEATFLTSRPVEQRIRGNGGWPPGDAAFAGQNPPEGAVITYYQRTRHLFGRISLQVIDPDGKVVDTIPAQRTARPQPRRVVDAGQAAAGAARGVDRHGRVQRPAGAAGALHRPAHQGRQGLRDDTGDRARSARDVHGGRSPCAGRGRDARARPVRPDERARQPGERRARGRRTRGGSAAREGHVAGAGRGARREGRRGAQEDRGDDRGGRDHRRRAAARARRPALRRHPVCTKASRPPTRWSGSTCSLRSWRTWRRPSRRCSTRSCRRPTRRSSARSGRRLPRRPQARWAGVQGCRAATRQRSSGRRWDGAERGHRRPSPTLRGQAPAAARRFSSISCCVLRIAHQSACFSTGMPHSMQTRTRGPGSGIGPAVSSGTTSQPPPAPVAAHVFRGLRRRAGGSSRPFGSSQPSGPSPQPSAASVAFSRRAAAAFILQPPGLGAQSRADGCSLPGALESRPLGPWDPLAPSPRRRLDVDDGVGDLREALDQRGLSPRATCRAPRRAACRDASRRAGRGRRDPRSRASGCGGSRCTSGTPSTTRRSSSSSMTHAVGQDVGGRDGDLPPRVGDERRPR